MIEYFNNWITSAVSTLQCHVLLFLLIQRAVSTSLLRATLDQIFFILGSILEFLGWIRKILGLIFRAGIFWVDFGIMIGKYNIESALQAKNSGVNSGVGFWGHSGVKLWGHEIKKGLLSTAGTPPGMRNTTAWTGLCPEHKLRLSSKKFALKVLGGGEYKGNYKFINAQDENCLVTIHYRRCKVLMLDDVLSIITMVQRRNPKEL